MYEWHITCKYAIHHHEIRWMYNWDFTEIVMLTSASNVSQRRSQCGSAVLGNMKSFINHWFCFIGNKVWEFASDEAAMTGAPFRSEGHPLYEVCIYTLNTIRLQAANKSNHDKYVYSIQYDNF